MNNYTNPNDKTTVTGKTAVFAVILSVTGIVGLLLAIAWSIASLF